MKGQASFILSIPITSAGQHLHCSWQEPPLSKRSRGVSLPANTVALLELPAPQISTDHAPFFLTSIRKERINLWILAAAVLRGKAWGLWLHQLPWRRRPSGSVPQRPHTGRQEALGCREFRPSESGPRRRREKCLEKAGGGGWGLEAAGWAPASRQETRGTRVWRRKKGRAGTESNFGSHRSPSALLGKAEISRAQGVQVRA